MTTRRPHTPPLLVIAAVALGGCGITDPYTHPASTRTTAPTRSVSTTSRQTATDPSEPATSKTTTIATAASGVTAAPSKNTAVTPRQAIQLYTRLYINWAAATISAHQRQLATMAQGTARAAALQAAASYSHDPELEHSRVANTGVIVSIAAGQGPAHGDWVIVTSEHTTGQGDYTGLPAAAHVTYAHLTHIHRGWVISQWSPQT